MSDVLKEIGADREKESVCETDKILGALIQKDQYVGDVYSMSYDSALNNCSEYQIT